MSASEKSSTALPAELEGQIDGLYALDLSEFVRRRDELARELKQRGEREASESVRSLEKATVPAWVVNRLALESSDSWQRLLDAGEGLRAAQQSGDGDELRQAQQERQLALDRLLGEAEGLLEESAHAASPATLEKVRRTLEAVAVYGRSGLLAARPGRLTRELDPPGFEVMATLSSLPARPRKSRKAKTEKPGSGRAQRGRVGKAAGPAGSDVQRSRREPADSSRRAELRRALRRAEDQLAKARMAEVEHEARVSELRAALAATREGLQRLRREAEKLEKEEARGARQLDAARESLERSRARRSEGERAVERARSALGDGKG